MKHYIIVQTFEDSAEYAMREVYHCPERAEERKMDLIIEENKELRANDCHPNAAHYFTVEVV